MVKKNIPIIALICITALCISFTALSPIEVLKFDGGPPYNTKAPGEKTCSGPESSNNCHSGGAGDDTGPATETILFSGGTQYVPGQTYTVTCKVIHPTRNRFGFQIVSLRNSDNANIGTITLLDTTRTRSQIPTFGAFQTRNYVMHRINGTQGTSNSCEWSYRWLAPATNQGAITFYACFNSANNNGANDAGDETNCTQLTITPGVVNLGSIERANDNVSVYPNPVNNELSIKYTLNKSSAFKAELVDLKGKLIQKLYQNENANGEIEEKIILNKTIIPGVYFINFTVEEKRFTKKIIIE